MPASLALVPSDWSWVHGLIGKPWVSGARGPDAFDCWGLVWHVYRTVLGIELDVHPGVDAKSTWDVARLVAGQLSRSVWTALLRPEPLCVVTMSANLAAHHVGLWLPLDGGVVLHSMDGRNTTAQTLVSLRGIGLQNVEFYRYTP